MSDEVFQAAQTREIIRYVRETYGDQLEFLWEKFPRDAIWRNRHNRKWYGLLLAVARRKLGLDSDEIVETLGLRFSKGEAQDFARQTPGVYPGYHMNKQNWITIILDGSMSTEQIISLLDQSYEISLKS